LPFATPCSVHGPTWFTVSWSPWVMFDAAAAAGVTALEAAEYALLPTAFFARTFTVYAVPFVRPVSVVAVVVPTETTEPPVAPAKGCTS
jgi:phosphatidylserine decarboxylase